MPWPGLAGEMTPARGRQKARSSCSCQRCTSCSQQCRPLPCHRVLLPLRCSPVRRSGTPPNRRSSAPAHPHHRPLPRPPCPWLPLTVVQQAGAAGLLRGVHRPPPLGAAQASL
jgi:hypothetical protein